MTALNDIENRADISLVVHTFYAQVRKDDVIGSIFNKQITDWDFHLDRIINFWEQILFQTRKYIGNPMETHVKVDKNADHQIEPMHFGRWLELWFSTINKYFEGENAEILKNQARKMQTVLYMRMWEHKPENK